MRAAASVEPVCRTMRATTARGERGGDADAERYVMSGGRSVASGDQGRRSLPLHRRCSARSRRRENSPGSVLPRHAFLSRFEMTDRRPTAGPALVDRRARVRRDHRVHQPRDAHRGRARASRRRRPHPSHTLHRRPRARAAAGAQLPSRRAGRAAHRPAFDADFADIFEVRAVVATGTARVWRRSSTATTLTLVVLRARRCAPHGRRVRTGRRTRSSGGWARFRLRLAPRERRILRFSMEIVGPSARSVRRGDFALKLGGCAATTSAGSPVRPTSSPTTIRSPRCCAAGRAICACCSPTVAGGAWSWRPSPGSSHLSAGEMAFSVSRPLMLDPRWRAGDGLVPRAVAGHAGQRLPRGAARQDHARAAPRRARRPARVPHTPRTTVRRRDGAVPAAGRRGGDVDRRPRVVRAAGPRRRGRPRLDRRTRRHRRRRVRRVRAPLAGRPLHQGWRDAFDAVLHDDGSPVEGPVALAEVQGYVYYAKRRLATVYGQLGDVERAERAVAGRQRG